MKKNRNRVAIVALTLLVSLLFACGDRADRTYRRGLRLARQKKYDQAVGEMRRLLQAEPDSIRARNALGQIYRAQNLYTRAIEELTLAAEMSREDPVPVYNLAGLYWDLDDLDQADRYYQQAIEIDPNFAPALYRLGAVSARAGDWSAAEGYFRAFLRTDPEDSAPGYNNLGVILWKKGKRAAAYQEFEKGFKADSPHPELLYNFGVASLLLKRQTRQGVDLLLDYFRVRSDGQERLAVKRLLEKSDLISSTDDGLFSRDDYFRQGDAYEAAGQYHLAEKEYRQALQLDQSSADLHYRLGRLYDRFLSDQSRAISHYETFLKLRPRSASAGEVIDRLNALRPPLTAVVPTPKRISRPDSSPMSAPPIPIRTALPAPDQCWEQVKRLAAEGDLDRALTAGRRCLKASPDYVPGHLELGKLLLIQGDYSAAAESLLWARKLDPDSQIDRSLGRAYVLLGAESLAAGRFQESIDYYKKARAEGMVAEADEGLWKSHHNYFRRLQESGNYPLAVQELESALKLRPKVEKDYIELADLYRERLNNPARARLYYRKYLELFPRGRYIELAREHLQPARPPATPVPSRPVLPPPAKLSAVEHYNQGAVYQREGRIREAREEYLQAIRLRSDFYQAYYNLGLIYLQAGDHDRALAAFKESARLKPDFPQAQLSLFNLYYHHYRMKNLARPYALRYIELAPNTRQAEELRRGLGI